MTYFQKILVHCSKILEKININAPIRRIRYLHTFASLPYTFRFELQFSLFNNILSKLEIHGEVAKKRTHLDEQARFIKLPIGWLMIVSFLRSDQCPRKPDAPVFVLEHVCSCVCLMCVVWLYVAETLANIRGFNIDYHFTQRLDYVDDAYSFGTQAVVKRDTSTAGGKWIGQHGSSASLFFVLPMASCLVVGMTPSYRV